MTNTKFRKRALLSSVAMLLVALVALGSATFAWYQAQLSVSASGMTFTTNAASGLEIVSASSAAGNHAKTATDAQLLAATWGTTTTFDQEDATLQPASLDPTANSGAGAFYMTTSEGPATSTMATGADISDSTDYVEETVYFKIGAGSTNTGDVVLTGATFTANATVMASATRIVVYKFDGTIAAEFAPTGNEHASYLTSTAKVEATHTDPQDDSSPLTGGKVVKAGGDLGTGNYITLGSITQTADDAYGAKVRVYLDGFDSTVYSNNATSIGGTNDILNGINVSFKMINMA